MLKYDIHTHTTASHDSPRQTPERLVSKAEKIGLDGVVITNHNAVSHIEKAREHSTTLDVVSGAEITTESGDILGIGIEECPSSRNAVEVVNSIHQQDGIAVIAHPFDPLRNSLNTDNTKLLRTADGVEVINSRCVLDRFNRPAYSLAEEYNLIKTSGSDAHFGFELGRAPIRIPSSENFALEESLEESEIQGSSGFVSGHIGSKLSKIFSSFTDFGV